MSDKFELKLKNKQEPLRLKLASGGFVAIPRDAIRIVTSLPENAVPGQVVALVSEDDEFSDGFYISQATEDETVKWELYLTSIDIVEWDDIKNKPFGETKHYDDLTYDGIIDESSVTTNKVEFYDQEICLVKVGELPTATTAANYISKSDTITLGNGEHFKTKDLISHETGGSAILYEGLGLPLAVAINEANTIINGYEYPEAGLYLIYSKFSDGTVITVENITFKTLIPLDEKYMPESYAKLLEDDDEHINSEIAKLNNENNLLKGNIAALQIDVSGLNSKTDFLLSNPLPGAAENINGSFLRVVNGKWAAVAVPSFEESEF